MFNTVLCLSCLLSNFLHTFPVLLCILSSQSVDITLSSNTSKDYSQIVVLLHSFFVTMWGVMWLLAASGNTGNVEKHCFYGVCPELLP